MGDYVAIYTKSVRDKTVAELRLQSALIAYTAAVTAGDETVVIDRHRAEIHALTDIVLDNLSMIAYCHNKIQGL